MVLLEEEFEESDLPYKVDLINYYSCDENFKKIMDSNNIILPKLDEIIPKVITNQAYNLHCKSIDRFQF